MRFELLSVLIIVACVGFVSADFFEGSCSEIKSVFEKEGSDFQIPNGVPFSDDIFAVYIEEDFLVSFELVDKKLESIGCDVSEDVSYNIFVSGELMEELKESSEDRDVVDFYNEKRASGDLKIKAVGFGNKLKLGFINFGLKIAGWFS
jgi:hypothetical protein